MADTTTLPGSQWQNFTNTAFSNLSNYARQNPLTPINTPTSTAAQVPAWLQPNMSELQNQYSSIPGQYQSAIAPLNQAYQDTINYNTGLGTQAANSAAQEYANRAAQAGGTSQASGVVRAQSLLPMMQQNTQARQQLAGTEASYQTQAIGLQTQVAQQLAQLRTSYASTLANYMTQQRGQNIQQQTSNLQAGLQANQSLLSGGTQLSTNPRAQGGFQGSGITTLSGQQYNAGTPGFMNASTSFGI